MNFIKKLFSFYLKLWRMMNKAGTVFLLLVIAGMILYNVGFPQEIQETLEARIFTQDGQAISCTLEVTGECTNYPFKKNSILDTLQISAGGRRLTTVSHISSSRKFAAQRHPTWDVTLAVHWNQRLLLAECDVQRIFPEMDSMRCVVVSPVMEAAEAAALLAEADVNDAMKAQFDWFLG